MINFLGYLLLQHSSAGKPTNYRGISRDLPMYADPSSPEGKLWFKMPHVAHHDAFFFIRDLEEALTLQADFSKLGRQYELIECLDVTTRDRPSKFPLLGYDVADNSCHSLIYEYGYYEPSRTENEKINFKLLEKDGAVVLLLTQKYFSRILNEQGLFDSYEDARLLLSAERYITEHLHDHPDINVDSFRVFKVSLVDNNPYMNFEFQAAEDEEEL